MQAIFSNLKRFWAQLASLEALWNWRLPSHAQIGLEAGWPLWLLPVALANQLLTPHEVWVVVLCVIIGLYTIGYLWVRSLAQLVSLQRSQQGAILVAGDSLHEDFALSNSSPLPVLWAEVVDQSDLPGYQAARVVSCDARRVSRWRTSALCPRRGIFRLGPQQLRLGDPCGLFSLTLHFTEQQKLLVYPRVAQLPHTALLEGAGAGNQRARRSFAGALPSASVRSYTPFDTLRFVHWPTTAHRGALMVKEFELEPGGTVWIVLDLQASQHSGEGEQGTLETAVMVAASLAAEALSFHERCTVGLLAVSGQDQQVQTVLVPPQSGSAQLWRILAALAPVQATDRRLSEVLRQQQPMLGRRGSAILVTPVQPPDKALESLSDIDWLAEALRLRMQMLEPHVWLITPPKSEAATDLLRQQLAQHQIQAEFLPVGAALRTRLTFRRRRTELRSTPTGGVVAVDVEEEVG